MIIKSKNQNITKSADFKEKSCSIDAEDMRYIASLLRNNYSNPLLATIREIIAAMKEANRDIKAHTIKRALTKSQFVFKSDEINVDGERHSLYRFTEHIFDE